MEKITTIIKSPYKKKSIPKALREAVWLKHCGKAFESKCKTTWCPNTMTVYEFHAGHNIPESRGGATTIDNLVPICSRCNLSMGNTHTFKEWCERYRPAASPPPVPIRETLPARRPNSPPQKTPVMPRPHCPPAQRTQTLYPIRFPTRTEIPGRPSSPPIQRKPKPLPNKDKKPPSFLRRIFACILQEPSIDPGAVVPLSRVVTPSST